MFDIETLDVESSAAVLSIAMIEFALDEKPVYKDLLNRAHFIKLDAREQITKYKRTVDKATLEWWSKRSKLVRDVSLTPKPDDLPLLEGLEKIRTLSGCSMDMKKNFQVMFWQRGGLDQVVFESLCRSADHPVFTHYSNWRDVRTALDLTVEGCVHGYAPVPWMDQDTVHKHDPVADCAYDICQLLVNNGKPDSI
jgi:hypothetical protein